MNGCKVSVLTLAFNHEKYIRQNIEGFLSQKTAFPIELLIHDDCSTDGTADIIREYAEKYPDKIHAVLQTENQYSKGVDPFSFLLPAAKGDYIAFCEGDDYWSSPDKLQKQVDFLDQHEEYPACVHNSTIINMKTGKKQVLNKESRAYDMELKDIIHSGSSGYHTSSLLVRKSLFLDAHTSGLLKIYPLDYTLSLELTLRGPVRYLPETMSVYRLLSGADSWSVKQEADSKKREYGYLKHIELMLAIDRMYQGKYRELTDPVIVNYCQRILQDYPLAMRWSMYRKRIPIRVRTVLGRVKRKLLGLVKRN